MSLQIKKMKRKICNTSLQLDLVNESSRKKVLDYSFMLRVLMQAIPMDTSINLCIKFVDKKQIKEINKSFRKKNTSTDVISFVGPGLVMDEYIKCNYMGDIVVCADYIEDEAMRMNKSKEAHWAHIILHGVLHLQGYDHVHDNDAIHMAEKEVYCLKKLGYSNPYI